MEKKSRRKGFKKKNEKGQYLGRYQPFSYSYEEENKLRCLGSLIIGESVFIHDYNIQDFLKEYN